ncbi:hypothetical protein BV20DRAFT_974891 [Pilatotrama ljubarskyi]|nr:hypothetical protein BV20DRAFT_974891 [Pilatotrama ljubarskyi]
MIICSLTGFALLCFLVTKLLRAYERRQRGNIALVEPIHDTTGVETPPPAYSTVVGGNMPASSEDDLKGPLPLYGHATPNHAATGPLCAPPSEPSPYETVCKP